MNTQNSGLNPDHRDRNSAFLNRIDFAIVNRQVSPHIPALLARWLPDGRRRGAEWFARNPRRNDRSVGSFAVNLRTGRWADFSIGERGGDVISLAAYLFQIKNIDAARLIMKMLGVSHG